MTPGDRTSRLGFLNRVPRCQGMAARRLVTADHSESQGLGPDSRRGGSLAGGGEARQWRPGRSHSRLLQVRGSFPYGHGIAQKGGNDFKLRIRTPSLLRCGLAEI